MAGKEGRATLEKLNKGEAVGLRWSPSTMVTLVRRQGLHDEAVQAVFGVDTAKLPAYVGVSAPDGRFVIYRVTRVEDLPSVSPEQVRAASAQIAQTSHFTAIRQATTSSAFWISLG